ncbi:MAG: amino acid transporter [Kofleriaceae bacterium]
MVPPPVGAWVAWTPHDVATRLAAVTTPWCIVGGWALDLWHGRTTRPHADLELAAPRRHFAELRTALADHAVFTVGDGTITCLPPGELPSQLIHQNWVLDPIAREWRVDLFLEPGDATTWIYRRDETIQLPRTETFDRTTDGIPYLRPELVLLFKAKAARPKDELDLATALPHLSSAARDRLRTLLARIHPGHAWIDALAP